MELQVFSGAPRAGTAPAEVSLGLRERLSGMGIGASPGERCGHGTRNTNPDKQQRGDEKLLYFGAGKLAGLGKKAQVLMWGCSCEGSRGVYTHSWWDGSAATRAAAATGECEVAEREENAAGEKPLLLGRTKGVPLSVCKR